MILKQMEATIEEYGLLQQGDRVLIAVSGGADSVCLLLCFSALKEKYGLMLSAFHLDHGIRGQEAERDRQFVETLCRRTGIPLTVRQENIPEIAEKLHCSLEEAGRKCRYELLEEEAKRLGAAAVAVAHHRNDQIETVLMNLLRGTGPRGLCGMEPERPLDPAGEIRLIRPLLAVSRTEIEDYLRDRQEPWCQDSTNADTTYSRNWIRQELLPLLEQHYPGCGTRIAGLSEAMREEELFFSELSRQSGIDPRQTELPLEALLKCPAPVCRRLLRDWLVCHGGVRDVGRSHYASLEGLLKGESGRQLDLPGGRRVLREQESLRILSGEREAAALPSWSGRIFPAEKKQDFPRKECTKWLDYDTIDYPPVLRFRQEGDYFLLPGGKHKSLKEYMIERRIPASERDRIPLFANGSHVLWLVGYRLSQGVYVSEQTKTIVVLSIGEDHEEASC